jgi:hypothetical protein
MDPLDVRVGPYLTESFGEVLLLLGEGTDPHDGVGLHDRGEVGVVDHKNLYLIPYSLLTPGQWYDGRQGSDVARNVGVDRLTCVIGGIHEKMMFLPAGEVSHGGIIDRYLAD